MNRQTGVHIRMNRKIHTQVDVQTDMCIAGKMAVWTVYTDRCIDRHAITRKMAVWANECIDGQNVRTDGCIKQTENVWTDEYIDRQIYR